MSDDYGLSAMASIIPVVVTGGIVMKFAEQIFPQPRSETRPRKVPRKPKFSNWKKYTKRPSLGIVGSGNFSNIGY